MSTWQWTLVLTGAFFADLALGMVIGFFVGGSIRLAEQQERRDLYSATKERTGIDPAPFPLYEPGPADRPFTVGDETDIYQAIRNVALPGDTVPDDSPTAEFVDKLRLHLVEDAERHWGQR